MKSCVAFKIKTWLLMFGQQEEKVFHWTPGYKWVSEKQNWVDGFGVTLQAMLQNPVIILCSLYFSGMLKRSLGLQYWEGWTEGAQSC